MSEKKVQHVHGILDRSGSMRGKTEDVIGGFKENVKNLVSNSNPDFSVYLSAKMFDNEEEVLLQTARVIADLA